MRKAAAVFSGKCEEAGIIRDVLDRIEDGCQVFGKELELVYANSSILERFPSPDPRLQKMHITDMYPGIENTDFYNVVQECLASEESRELEGELAFPARDRERFRFWILPVEQGVCVLSRSIDAREKKSLAGLQSLAMDASMDGMAILDSEERYFYANQAHAAVYGYEAPEELLGRSWRVLYEKDELERFETEIIPQLYRDGRWSGEAVGKRKDGTLFPQELSLTALDEGGLICVVRDISLRRGTQEALSESQMRMQSIARSAPVGIGRVVDRVLTHANNQLCDMLGYSRDDLLGKNARILYPGDEEYEFVGQNKYEQIESNWLESVETRFQRSDGTVIDVLLRSTPVDLENPSRGITFTALDISEIKESERVLRESEEKFEKILGVVPDMISIHDPEMNILYSNWNGYASVPEEKRVVGAKCYATYRDFEDICPDCRAKEVLATKSPFQEEVQLEEGTWIDLRVLPVLDEVGNVEIFMEWVRDISLEKEALLDRERLQLELGHARKMESVGRLAGGVAHDYNNMLNVILNRVEMALDQVGDGHELHEDLEEIRSAARRSADLTSQLLAFARRQPVAPEVLDLNTTVTAMLKMLSRLIGEGIELIWKPYEDLKPVRIDPAQVDQVLANLVVNARDAIGGQAGAITIMTGLSALDEDASARLQDCDPGEYVTLEVSDTGSGMDEDTLSRVFEPFFTTKKPGEGTGLGLAMVYGIVKQNGGFIEADSEQGRGTSFTVFLPAVESVDEDISEPVQQSSHRHPQGEGTILIVEDEPAILKLGAAILEQYGYSVLSADAPGDALEVAAEYEGELDLVITDVVMPEMNGRELTQQLRSLYPDIHCLYMSGYPSDVIADQGILLEGIHFLQKPFSIRDLISSVQDSLDHEQE